MDLQWQYKRGQWVIYVLCHYGMAVVGRGLHQKLWYVFDDNVINSALHGANQVVVKVGDLYGLLSTKPYRSPTLTTTCFVPCNAE